MFTPGAHTVTGCKDIKYLIADTTYVQENEPNHEIKCIVKRIITSPKS